MLAGVSPESAACVAEQVDALGGMPSGESDTDESDTDSAMAAEQAIVAMMLGCLTPEEMALLSGPGSPGRLRRSRPVACGHRGLPVGSRRILVRACWLCLRLPRTRRLGGGGEVVLDHKPFLADDAPQRGRCGPALRLKHAAVVGELQASWLARSSAATGAAALGVGTARVDVNRTASPASMLRWCLTDRNVAASGTYQDVGGPDRAAAASWGRRAPTTTAASAAIADVVASTCSSGDAAWSTNTQSEPATVQLGHDGSSKATSSVASARAVGSSGTAGSTRSSWTRRGHRLATYGAAGPAPVGPLSEAHAGGGIADPQPGGSRSGA